MQKKYEGKHAKRLFNLTGYTNRKKAMVELLTEKYNEKHPPGGTTQDALLWAIGEMLWVNGVNSEDIDARAAELDAADEAKGAQ